MLTYTAFLTSTAWPADPGALCLGERGKAPKEGGRAERKGRGYSRPRPQRNIASA